jgi:hypothetical protein
VVVGHVTAGHGRGHFPGISQGDFRPGGGNGPGMGGPGQGNRDGSPQGNRDDRNGGQHGGNQDNGSNN